MSTLLAILLAFPSIDSAHSLVVNTTSVLHAPITSALSTATNLTIATITKSCDDIHTCRTLYSIVQTCLATIFACVWVAVHRNIPAPKPVLDPKLELRPFKKALRWLRPKIRDLRQPVIVFSRLRAGGLMKELEKASLDATKRWEEAHPEIAEDRATATSGRGSPEDLIEKLSSAARKPSNPTHTEEECAWYSARRVGKLDQATTKTHAFFAIMGGYQACDENGPIHPLDPDEVVKLVRDGKLVPPTGSELSNQSKGDVLSKGVVILQTVWFVVQCIARLVGNLPLTNLEVMTLAYTVMTVAMYVAWWDKPLNVSCAIRVPGARAEEMTRYHRIWETIFFYVIGAQDDEDLDYLQRVPTFWAGTVDEDDFIKADIIALLVAMAFGASGNYEREAAFPSSKRLLEERCTLWRAGHPESDMRRGSSSFGATRRLGRRVIWANEDEIVSVASAMDEAATESRLVTSLNTSDGQAVTSLGGIEAVVNDGGVEDLFGDFEVVQEVVEGYLLWVRSVTERPTITCYISKMTCV
ncbi:hypothetical protein HWV62_4333 [Athelia sp. TMB]|nr:hypothetical protein HWV62_4333 [Athelia sp. TMB]